MIKKYFELKRDEATGKRRQFPNEEIRSMSLPVIIRAGTFERMGWTGHILRMG